MDNWDREHSVEAQWLSSGKTGNYLNVPNKVRNPVARKAARKG